VTTAVLQLATYIWRYNCVVNSNESTHEPQLEQEFYRCVGSVSYLVDSVGAGHDRAAAALALVLYFFKLLSVEETECAIKAASISGWLELVRWKSFDATLDFTRVESEHVRFYESAFLLLTFHQYLQLPPAIGMPFPREALVGVGVGGHETVSALAVVQSDQPPQDVYHSVSGADLIQPMEADHRGSIGKVPDGVSFR